MNNKIILAIISILFLTVQACSGVSFGGISSGLAAECIGEGTVVCDGTDAYQCQLASYGVGYYVSRAPGFDVSACDATEEEDGFDSDTLERRLISISSDLEDVIDDLEDIQVRAAEAEADEDGRALQVMKREVAEIRTTLSDISDVMDDIADDIVDASADGEDVTEVESLYDTAATNLAAAENLETDVSEQIVTALAALLGDGSGTDCSTDSTVCGTGEACSSSSVCETDTDGDGDADSDDLDDDDDGYTDVEEDAEGTDSLDATDYPEESCTDADGGINYEEYGGTTVTTDSGTTYYTESCSGDGLTLTEYSFASND